MHPLYLFQIYRLHKFFIHYYSLSGGKHFERVISSNCTYKIYSPTLKCTTCARFRIYMDIKCEKNSSILRKNFKIFTDIEYEKNSRFLYKKIQRLVWIFLSKFLCNFIRFQANDHIDVNVVNNLCSNIVLLLFFCNWLWEDGQKNWNQSWTHVFILCAYGSLVESRILEISSLMHYEY